MSASRNALALALALALASAYAAACTGGPAGGPDATRWDTSASEAWKESAVEALYATVTPPDPAEVIGTISVSQEPWSYGDFSASAMFWDGPAPSLSWADPAAYGTCVPVARDESGPAPFVSAGTVFFDGGGALLALLTQDGPDSGSLPADWGSLFALTSSGGSIAPFDLDPALALPAIEIAVHGWPALNEGEVAVGDHLSFTYEGTDPYASLHLRLQVDRVDPITHVITTRFVDCTDVDDGSIDVVYTPGGEGELYSYYGTLSRRRVRYARVPEGWIEIVTSGADLAVLDYRPENP